MKYVSSKEHFEAEVFQICMCKTMYDFVVGDLEKDDIGSAQSIICWIKILPKGIHNNVGSKPQIFHAITYDTMIVETKWILDRGTYFFW